MNILLPSRSMRCLFLWFVFSCSVPVVGYTQQPFYKNYQLNEGLLSNYIYSVFQDSKGYIWLSSDVGVSRFDGQSFVHFNTSHGLPDNEVFNMLEDTAGRIWFATLNGKPGYYEHGVFYAEHNSELLKKCRNKGMTLKLFQQKDGRIVYCSTYQTLLLDLKTGEVETRVTENGIAVAWANPDESIGAVSIGFGLIEPAGFRKINKIAALTQSIQVINLGDSMLISANRELHLIAWKSGRAVWDKTLLPIGNHFLCLKMLGNKLWAGTRNGVLVFDFPTMKLERTYLEGRSVSSILEDREGGLWFSTFEEGIFYVPDPDILQFGQADGLHFKRIICLSRDAQDRLWIGSEGSAYTILDKNRLETSVIFPKNVANKNIRNIRHFKDGSTLVVSKAGAKYIQGNRSKIFVHRASDINIRENGDYVIGLNGFFDIPKSLVEKKYLPVSEGNIPDMHSFYGMPAISSLKGFKVEKIEFDQYQNAWVATHSGLVRIDTSGREAIVLRHSTLDLDFDPQTQTMWVLSESRGVFVVKDGQVVDSIAISNQFGDVICRDICRDESGKLWIGTASGLFRVQYVNGKLELTNFRGVLGLGAEKINAVEVIGNIVFIGKDDGLLSIPKPLLLQSPPSPPALIKMVRVNSRPQVPDADGIFHMAFGAGSLSLEFEGLSYREPQYIRYRYKLSGLDEQWHETANEALEFASLRPGKYKFEVYAVNGAGEIGPVPAVVWLAVDPPIWLQPWFYMLMAVLAATAIWAYVRLRMNKLRQEHIQERTAMENLREKAELQNKITELKMLALRLQMNPHFIFNALNTIKGYYGQDKTIEANAFIGKFARLLRLNLDYSDAMIPLDQEVELLKIYLQLSQIRYPDKIEFTINTDPQIHQMEILIPSMLLQPFVENAVIHGVAPKKERGLIQVNFHLVSNEIIATVKDSGVGRKAAEQLKFRDQHKPLATQITLERLKILRKNETPQPLIIEDLYDEKGKPAGTCVTLHIPYSRANSD
jgi:ligand-binding sensor domain-containing protein